MVEDDKRRAFEKIYHSHKRLVWTTTGRFFHENDKRWDAFQNTWERVAKYFQKFFSAGCEFLPGYLVTITKNECKNLLVKEKRERSLPLELAGEEDFAAAAETRQGAARAKELLALLPRHYRAVLEMRLVLEMSNSEVAKALEITPAKASTWYRRGRDMLVRRLKEEGITYE